MLPDMDEDEVADVLYDTAARPSELLENSLEIGLDFWRKHEGKVEILPTGRRSFRIFQDWIVHLKLANFAGVQE